MTLFNVISLLIVPAAAFSWLNHRFLRLPNAIGLMLIALLMSLELLALGPLGRDVTREVEAMPLSVHFGENLLHGMLSFLLFAGAVHVNLDDLARQRWVIAILATASLVTVTYIVVVFSILVQGLTLVPLVRATAARADLELRRTGRSEH